MRFLQKISRPNKILSNVSLISAQLFCNMIINRSFTFNRKFGRLTRQYLTPGHLLCVDFIIGTFSHVSSFLHIKATDTDLESDKIKHTSIRINNWASVMSGYNIFHHEKMHTSVFEMSFL